MGSGLISRKFHLPFVQQEMLGDTRSEIAVPVRANANNSWGCSTVSPIFAPLVEKIDSVVRQFGGYERKCNWSQSFKLFLEPFAEFRQRAAPFRGQLCIEFGWAERHMLLVIVPCGRSKIWKKQPHLGPTPAREAYTGAPFKVNREYAESVADRWVILSAKYGFIEPTTPITQYEVTFKKKNTHPISALMLREQVADLGLLRFDEVIALGGKEYRSVVEDAFAGTAVKLMFPFSGLTVGRAMRAVKQDLAQRVRIIS